MMTSLIDKYYNIHSIWLAMLFLTLVTYTMGRLDYSGALVMLFLLSTAAIKATFIIREYMELRGVSLLWRVIMYGWLTVVCVTIGIAYIISL